MYTGIVTALGSALLGAFWGYKNIKAARLNEQAEENERFNTYSDYLIKMANEIQEKYINNVNAMIKTYPRRLTFANGSVLRRALESKLHP